MLWMPIQKRLQGELIKRGFCVGCGRNLAQAERTPSKVAQHFTEVTCRCQRVYLYDNRINSYRRALSNEVID